ncbi:hypothetical protein GGS24DRAFT_462916 [Hypoxylon argillaceum]|nr:hypothetical protein GGS24DRAFT_462916 [Hypoxylon argillaceum]
MATPQQPATRQETPAPTPPSPSTSKPTTLHISDRAALATAWRSPHAILTHLNADTTWLLHLPYPEGAVAPPPRGRSRLTVLLDPWLRGPQSDGGRWFSIQWHVTAPSVQTLGELSALLGELEAEATSRDGGATDETETRDGDGDGDGDSRTHAYIDVVAISHEFTDHCHEATLCELPRNTPVFAPDKAARLIRSWKHFDAVTEMPAFLAAGTKDWRAALNRAPLPSWVGIGRVVTPGNALYYHSALIVAWAGPAGGDAIIYSPHGIDPGALSGIQSNGLRTLALLHGLDDIRLRMLKQLNLGAVNGVAAARECGAKYWVATHDEPKKGGGIVSLLLERTRWSVADAVKSEGRENGVGKGAEGAGQGSTYEFVELGSGDALVLE